MRHDDFLVDLAKVVEVDASFLKEEVCLASLNTWDSLSIVSTIALVDSHFNIQIDGEVLTECKTLRDIFQLIDERSV